MKSRMMNKRWLAGTATFAYLSLGLAPVYASDTEIYTQAQLTNAAVVAPTMVMMIDTSGSMNECVSQAGVNPTSCTVGDNISRITSLKNAMNKILLGDGASVKAAPGYIKMGLSRYKDDSNGGYIKYPARPLDAFVDYNPDGTVKSQPAAGNDDTEQGLTSVNTSNTLTIGMKSVINQGVGIRFTAVRIPKGATINQAYIKLTAAQSNTGGSTFEIKAEASGDTADYSSTALNSRSYGSTANTFIPDPWTANSSYQVDVTAPLQVVANRSDWCGGNDVSFRIQDIGLTPTTRVAYSYEGAVAAADMNKAPQLVVNFTIDPDKTDSCVHNIPRVSTFAIPVTTAGKLDDVDYTTTTVKANLSTSTGLQLNTVTSGVKNVVGVRFNSIAIPPGSNVTAATLYGTARTSVTGVQPILVQGYKTTNLPAFCTASTTCSTPAVVNAIALTTNNTVWTPSGSSLTSNTLYGIDVTNITKEIIGQSGWVSGNSLGFALRNNTSTTGSAGFYSADSGTASRTMYLQVNWVEATVNNLSTLRTVRDDLVTEVAALPANSSTPLAAAYAESMRYIMGLNVYTNGLADPKTTVNGAGVKYQTPLDLTNTCPSNYVFLLTDGEPNGLYSADANTAGITGHTCDTSLNSYISGTSDTTDWRCMFDLAKYSSSTTNSIKQRVRTSTVIFGPLGGNAEKNMQQVATFGQGKYFHAGDEAALVSAITATINDLLDVGGTIAAPGVAVNQLNRLNHLDQLYYAVFDPDPTRVHWEGNLKRYRLGLNESQVLDVNNANAVDPSTGFFKEGAQSFWSPAADGAKATEGGASSVLPAPDSRQLYSYLGSLGSKNQPLVKIDLTSSAFNTAAKTAIGGSIDDNTYKNLMNWYKGYVIPDLSSGLVAVDSTTGKRFRLGAGLHSKPLLINYGYTAGTDANNPSNQANVVFFSTLEGTLHGIDGNTGVEKFAFIPGEKLATLKTLYDNPTTSLPEFGMDLTWTVYREDKNFDNQIDNSGNDKVYLYGGMRMGGKNYYALDLTSLTSPKLMFAIQGGSTGAYANMGQTWSQPVVANMKVNGSVKTVLVFGGGYDPRHETPDQLFTGNDLGNAIYIVDAFDGTLYWWASADASASKVVSSMTFSVPGSPKIIDYTGDGLADAIYFGDLGGQLFRVDISNNNTGGSGLAKRVKLVAKIGQTGSTASTVDQRRIYEPPTVAMFQDSTKKAFAAVGFGSGYRSHPLNASTQDRYFVVFDYDLGRSDLKTIAENDTSLQATATYSDLVALNLSNTTGATITAGKKGWYVPFPAGGEKSMAAGLIFQNQLIFTTYVPASSGNECAPVVGYTNVYTMCMPYGDVCSGDTTRVKENIMVGIGGEPQLVIRPSDGSNTVGSTNKMGIVIGTAVNSKSGTYSLRLNRMHRWREKTKNDLLDSSGANTSQSDQ